MSSRQILVVDDNVMARTLVERSLASVSVTWKTAFVLHLAESFESATEIVLAHGVGNFDLVVTDYAMPEKGDGTRLLAMLRNAIRGTGTPAMPVIVLSSDDEASIRQECRALGLAVDDPQAIIAKGDNWRSELLATIKRLLAL